MICRQVSWNLSDAFRRTRWPGTKAFSGTDGTDMASRSLAIAVAEPLLIARDKTILNPHRTLRAHSPDVNTLSWRVRTGLGRVPFPDSGNEAFTKSGYWRGDGAFTRFRRPLPIAKHECCERAETPTPQGAGQASLIPPIGVALPADVSVVL